MSPRDTMPRPAVHPRTPPRLRAFTLVELIVVVVILAILATLITPRLTGQAERAAEAEAIAVQRLLSAAAERAALVGGQRLAVEYTKSESVARLALVERGATDPAGAPQSRQSELAWRPDRLVEPVVLAQLELSSAAVDNRRLDPNRWLAPLGGAQARPAIALVLAPRRGERGAAYRIELAPDAASATRAAIPASDAGALGGRAPAAQPARAIDLDAAGRGDSPW